MSDKRTPPVAYVAGIIREAARTPLGLAALVLVVAVALACVLAPAGDSYRVGFGVLLLVLAGGVAIGLITRDTPHGKRRAPGPVETGGSNQERVSGIPDTLPSKTAAIDGSVDALISRAEQLRAQDRPSEARAVLDEVVRTLGTSISPGQEGLLSILRGKIERAQGNTVLARQNFQRALNVLPPSAAEELATARLQLGITLGQQDDRVGSYRELKAALRDFRALSNRFGEGQAALELGELQKTDGNYEAALSSLNEALTAFDTVRNALGLANVERTVGSIERLRDRPTLAIPHLERARDAYRAAESSIGEAQALYELGEANAQLGHFDEARRLHKEALQKALAVHFALGVRNGYLALANLEAKRDRFDNAAEEFRRAIDYCRSNGDILGEAQARLGLGSCLGQFGDVAGARIELKRAGERALMLKDAAIGSDIRCNEARLDLQAGSTDQAIAGFREAFTLAEEADDLALRANALLGLGNALLQGGQSAEADPTLERARSMFNQARMVGNAAFAGLSLASLRLGQGKREGCTLLKEVITELEMAGRLDALQSARETFAQFNCH